MCNVWRHFLICSKNLVSRGFQYCSISHSIISIKRNVNLILLTFIFTFLIEPVRRGHKRLFKSLPENRTEISHHHFVHPSSWWIDVWRLCVCAIIAKQVEQLFHLGKKIADHPQDLPFFDVVTNVFGDFKISSFFEKGLISSIHT